MYEENKSTLRIALLVILLQAGLLLMFCGAANAQPFQITNPSSLWKVMPVKGDGGQEAETLWIAMSRGEFEPAQIVVHASDEPLCNVQVKVSGLVGSDGRTLSQERVVVNPMGFIQIEGPTRGRSELGFRSEGGEVPDVLLPDRPMDVPAGRRQPYYITVRTLRSDQAGEYRGTVRVSADGERVMQIPLVVRVYDIALPVKSHLKTAFGLDAGYRKIEGADPAADFETLLDYTKFLLEHRISPRIYGYSYDQTGVPPKQLEDGTWDFAGTDKYLSELVPLGLTTFYTHKGAGIPAYANHLKKRGWYDLAHVYIFDEAPMNQLPKMIKEYSALTHAVPGVKILQVAWSPTKPLEGLVNIWCPELSHADLEGLRRARERGEEAWWYSWDAPWRPYPNICHIDDLGIYARMTGWMTYHYRIQGFLYWSVDIWDTNKSRPDGGRLSVDEYDQANYANWKPNTYGKTSYGNPRNGDGYLIYPGKGNRPLASLRLAHTRDGFEDYDLFKEVESLAEGHSQAAVRARELLDFSLPSDRPIILSLRKWSKSDNMLLRRREEVLKIGEQLLRPNDMHLKTLREKQDERADALYPLETEKQPEKQRAFGATVPAKAHCIDGIDYTAMLPKLRRIATLPLDGWLFKDDPDAIGVENGYFNIEYPREDMAAIKIADFWDSQGYENLRDGWYRLNYRCPALPDNKRVYLHFGAVDESAWLYVDGKQVAWYDTADPFTTWTQPFLLDVTGSLESRKEHLLVIRVQNTHGAGGIYKSVSLMVQK